eukprot:364625-Chlamydomonas_euryale.AAC.8
MIASVATCVSGCVCSLRGKVTLRAPCRRQAACDRSKLQAQIGARALATLFEHADTCVAQSRDHS